LGNVDGVLSYEESNKEDAAKLCFCTVGLIQKRPEITVTTEHQQALACGLSKGVISMTFSGIHRDFEVTTFFKVDYLGPDWSYIRHGTRYSK